MGDRLPPTRTPLTRVAVANGLLVAWPELETPTRAGVRILTAQIDGETNLASCLANNVGNIKGSPADQKRCHTYYPCGEEIPASKVPFGDPRIRAVARYVKQGVEYASIKITPDHPWSCFRAYRTLPEALVDYLAHLSESRTQAWAALRTPGDPDRVLEAFCLALGRPDVRADGKRIGAYYTASAASYVRLVRARYAKVLAEVPDDHPVWGDVL